MQHAFWYIFLAIPDRPRREIFSRNVSWGTLTQKEECFFLFVHLGAVPKKSTPGKFTYRVHVTFSARWNNKTKLEKKTKSFFLIVTVVVAKALYWNTVTLGEPLRRREIEI